MSNLQEAFREAARREFAMVPAEEELDYVFSRKFERNMQKIIRAQVYGYWNLVNTAAKRVACIAAIIAMLLTTAMAIKPIRERVIKFFVEVYEEYFLVTFGEEASGDLDPTPEPMIRYTFSWMPEGYEEITSIESNVQVSTFWKREGGVATLVQSTGSYELTLDNKDRVVREIETEDVKIKYELRDETYDFIWEQYDYIFHLTVSDILSLEENLQMIGSLTEIK